MTLVKPYGRKIKFDVRVRLEDGKVVRLPGYRDEHETIALGNKIDKLIRAKAHRDSPPVDLKVWIDNLPQALADRLVELGLLERQRIDRSKGLAEHIDEFEAYIKNRKTNSPTHAQVQSNRVRAVCAAIPVTAIDQLNENNVSKAIASITRSVGNKRHHIVVTKQFTRWAKKSKLTSTNELEDMPAPDPYEDPEVERQPLSVNQFRLLVDYLDGFQKYGDQRSRWTASDRKLIYWTAVKSAFRKMELKMLLVANLNLYSKPPSISVKAKNAKNKTSGDVPIPNDLCAALRAHVKGKEPQDRVFDFPITSRSLLRMFRRDLKGAGIPSKLPTGERVDFHTLRSTAITWWLDVDGLPAKRVQVLARLKTLGLVAKYSRNLRLDEFRWLNKGAKLVTPKRQSKHRA